VIGVFLASCGGGIKSPLGMLSAKLKEKLPTPHLILSPAMKQKLKPKLLPLATMAR
jgi:hypothetical protein